MRVWARLLILWGLLLASAAAADDRDVLTAFLEDNLSGAGRVVTVTGFRGALSSQASIQELTVADGQGVWLRLRGVTLDWNRAALLGGTLEVKRLAAEEIDLDRLPVAAPQGPQAEAAPFALPQLPVAVVVGDVSAGQIRLGAPVLGQAVEGSLTADASLVSGQGHLRIEVQRTDGITGLLSLIAVYADDTGQLTLAVKAEEAAGGLAVSALGVPGRPAAKLIFGGKGPLDGFAATLALETDGVTRLAGNVTTTKAPEDQGGGTGFAADLSGNMAPLFAPDYAAFFGNRVALTVTGQRRADGVLDLRDLSLQAAALRLGGQVQVGADGLPERVALKGTMALPDGAPVLLPLPGTETRLDRADLDITYDRAVGPDWTAQIIATALDRPDLRADRLALEGRGQVRHEVGARGLSARLSLAAEGLAMTDPALAAALGPQVAGVVSLDWQAGAGAVQLSDLNLTAGPEVEIATQGTIGDIASGLRTEGKLRLRADDLRRFALLAGRPLAGGADAVLDGWISPLSGQFDADISVTTTDLKTGVAQADGLLTGAAQMALSGKRDEGGTLVRRLQVTASGVTADLSGSLTSAGALLNGQVALPDLARLGLGLTGALSAQAKASGLLEDGRLELTGAAQDLTMGLAEADALGRGPVRLDLAVTRKGSTIGVERATLISPAGQIAAEGSYDPKAVDLGLDLTLPDLGVLRPGWRGGLGAHVQLSGEMQHLAAQVQADTKDLAIGQPVADRLLGGAGELIAALALEDGQLVIQGVDFSNPDISVNLSGPPQDLAVQARLGNLALILPQFPGALTAQGQVRQTAAGTALDLALRGPGQIDARLAGTLAPDFSRADLTARGTAQAGLANVLIAPRVVAGRVSFDLALRGPLALASLSGQARVSDGRVADPSQPVALTGLAGQAVISGGAARVDMTSSLTTGGQVAVTGRVGLVPPLPSDLAITLTGAVLRSPDLFRTTLNGSLTFKGPALGGAQIAGTLTLGRSELRIPSTGMSAVPVLEGLHHRNDPPPVRSTRVRAGMEGTRARSVQTRGGGFGLDVLILAENQVFVRGRGLDAELGGRVRLRGTTADIVPSGALTLIRGRLDLLGKRLVLTEATLQMQGALVPFVRIAATTDSDGFAISAVIEGDATDPEVIFTSTPQLPQEEVIARLLFDKSLQSLSPFQAAQLASAVATLAGKGGDGVIGKLRKSAGLDNLDVQSDATGNTSVTAGKYLSDKVYTEVTVDQTGQSTVTLNLDVARHITVKGKVQDDGQTGIGIYLEKDY